MKKKSFFAPSQMILLTSTGTGTDVGGNGSNGGAFAKPDPNLDDEGEILFPGGEGSAPVSEGDVVIPDADADLAYTAVPEQ